MYTSYTAKQLDAIFSRERSIYFIGIGGISMSSLAHIAHDRRLGRVAGYDRTKSPLTEALERDGIEISYELSPKHIAGFDVIVYTAAIKPDQPELAAALEADRRGEKFCVYRADFLGWLMSHCDNRIGISGMHGKSTCTSMTSAIFLAAERNPTIVSGAELPEIGGAYRLGTKRDFIMEACEYQDSFLSFTPNIAVILNIELDHTDYFSGLEQIIDSFRRYAAIAREGVVIANVDDPEVVEAVSDAPNVISFALESDADYTAKNLSFDHGCAQFDLVKRGELLTHVKLSVTGRHNVYNALAAAASADFCGVEADSIAAGLASYHGAKRRMELKGEMLTDSGAKIPVYDDYAHHPTEIKATLSGALEMGFERVFVVFQPHTYSRTSSLFEDFAHSFDGVHAIFADIYAAREVNESGVTSEALAKAAGGLYLPSFEAIDAHLRRELREGDVLIVMGAGDIIGLDRLLLK